MGMPNNIFLVRHGQSEGNIATERSKKGDHSAFVGAFMDRHSSQWRLSSVGVEQAKTTGEWIRSGQDLEFDRHYVSDYIRAVETAGHLGIEGAEWYTEFYLRERNWGDIDRMSVKDRYENHAQSMRDRDIDSFYWKPPNGESIADLCLRIDRIINTLHRECDQKNVVIVCHGEVMWAFRIRLERMSQEEFIRLDKSKDPKDRIHNCHIIHYTRNNPFCTGKDSLAPYLGWMRSLCPHKGIVEADWKEIVRSRYSNEQLLNRAERVDRIIVE